jgi:hypothetical protein
VLWKNVTNVPGSDRRIAPAVRPGNIVSIKMSAEGAAPCIHTPISESRIIFLGLGK